MFFRPIIIILRAAIFFSLFLLPRIVIYIYTAVIYECKNFCHGVRELDIRPADCKLQLTKSARGEGKDIPAVKRRTAIFHARAKSFRVFSSQTYRKITSKLIRRTRTIAKYILIPIS